MAKNSTISVCEHKQACLPEQQNKRNSDLCCHASVNPGAHSFKIKGALHFEGTLFAVPGSKQAGS